MKERFAPDISRIFLCLLLILTALTVAQAQSGRRSPKPLSPPTPVPTPKEEETPAPATSKPAQPQHKLIVGMDDMSGATMIPRYMSEAIWSGFVERFKGISSLTISTDRNIRGKGASDRAKKETESFVVLLQLDTNYINTTTTGRVYADDVVINYFLYAPGTGKTKAQGRVYVRTSRSPLPTGRSGEAQLYDAGRETAERVLSALNKESPAILR